MNVDRVSMIVIAAQFGVRSNYTSEMKPACRSFNCRWDSVGTTKRRNFCDVDDGNVIGGETSFSANPVPASSLPS